MPDNDVIVTPDNPTPAPKPGPAPAASVTPADLKADIDMAVKMIRGVGTFMPASVKAQVERAASLIELAGNQPWLLEIGSTLLNRFGESVPAAGGDAARQAFLDQLIKSGQQPKK